MKRVIIQDSIQDNATYIANMDRDDSSLYPLLYDPNYPFLFCILCEYAVLVPSIPDHLKGVYKDVPADRRKFV